MASQYPQLFREGHVAYLAGRSREAALLFGRAREVAKQEANIAGEFEAGFWEAEAWVRAGEVRRVYGLLFALLANAPEEAPPYARWLAEKKVYIVWLSLGRRSRAERLDRLERLRAFAAIHPKAAAGDLPELWATLAEESADWREALSRFEEAWTAYENWGFLRVGKAYGAFLACLRLGQEEEASRWLQLLEQTDQDHAEGRAALCRGRVHMALYRGCDRSVLEASRHALDQALIGVDDFENAAGWHLLARLHLLLRRGEDPEDPFHPARAELRRWPEARGPWYVWSRTLIVTDFRLASVRYAAEVPPCDDYYYRQPQRLPERVVVSPEMVFRERLRRARVAIKRLEREAQILDELNEATWYSSQAKARLERLEEILGVVVEEGKG